MKWFEYRENTDGRFSIIPVYKNFKEDWKIMGSWSVLPARIFGLSWPDYLRYCIQNGAIVVGKEHRYPYISWKEKNVEFLNDLNRRANIVIQL